MDEATKNEILKSMRVETIREYWYYPDGSLEEMSQLEVKEIYEMLLDQIV